MKNIGMVVAGTLCASAAFGDLAEFGFAGRTVRRIEPIGGLVNPKAPEMKQVGEDLGLKIFPGAQAWRIVVE